MFIFFQPIQTEGEENEEETESAYQSLKNYAPVNLLCLTQGGLKGHVGNFRGEFPFLQLDEKVGCWIQTRQRGMTLEGSS